MAPEPLIPYVQLDPSSNALTPKWIGWHGVQDHGIIVGDLLFDRSL